MMRMTLGGRKPRSSIALAILLVAVARAASADVINFTGNVGQDFGTSTAGDVATIAGRPGSVAEAPYITANGWTSGFLIQSARMSYDKATDTLYVGIQSASIVGDADGHGNNTTTSAQEAARGGINYAHFGGDKTLTVAFANVNAQGTYSAPVFVAGIPSDKALGDTRNTNDFTVATYSANASGLGDSYGTILNGHTGALAVDPSASAPGFEFAIKDVSKIPGFDPANGFFVNIFLGSAAAVTVGKEEIWWTKVPVLIPSPGAITDHGSPISVPVPNFSLGAPFAVPEPSAIVLFAVGGLVMAGLAARKLRRRAA